MPEFQIFNAFAKRNAHRKRKRGGGNIASGGKRRTEQSGKQKSIDEKTKRTHGRDRSSREKSLFQGPYRPMGRRIPPIILRDRPEEKNHDRICTTPGNAEAFAQREGGTSNGEKTNVIIRVKE